MSDEFLENDEFNSSESLAAPSNYNFLKQLDLDQDVVRRLSLHLDGIRKGNSEVYLSPLCKHINPQSILGMWDRRFNSLRDEMNNVLISLELSNRSKFSPRSIAKPWSSRLPSVEEYYEGRPRVYSFSPNADPLDVFLPNTMSLRAISLSNAINSLKNNTNSGLPYYCRKSRIKDRLSDDFNYLLIRQDPCVLFTRTQENNKTRNVWGYPVVDTLNESMIYQPLLSHQRNLSWRAALRSPDSVSFEVTKLLSRAMNENKSILSVDFTSFDSSVTPKLIDQSFKYILSLFQPKFWEQIEYIANRFANIPLLTPDGIITGSHGVPSGSTFTNEVDSLSQYFAALSSKTVNDSDFNIQGDDGVYLVENSKVNHLLAGFNDSNLKIHDIGDKSYYDSNYCIYLQNLFHTDYYSGNGLIGGIYPTYRALNRILYQERWSDFEDYGLSGKDYYSIRTISILENVKYHPLFKEFVEFIVSLDKYSLEYTQEGLAKYCNMLKLNNSSEGFMNNQYGDNVSGLNSFETVKIIREIA
jgi:hypothetical protein